MKTNAVGNPIGKMRRNPSPGLRIVHNKLLGGWFIVRGPHQTPIGGRFASKAEAEAHLRQDRTEGIRYSLPRVRRNPTLHLKRKRAKQTVMHVAQRRGEFKQDKETRAFVAVFNSKSLAVQYASSLANMERKTFAVQKDGSHWIVREVKK